MLTIKHIREDGSQNVFPASSAIFMPEDKSISTPEGLRRVEFSGQGMGGYVSEGTVYVMNAEGKTVSKWPLTGTVYLD